MSTDNAPQMNQLKEIMDFAIAKEQEAIDFYTGLAASAKWDAIANELRSIAAMEVGHKQRLQALDVRRAASSVNSRFVDMKIADYLVAAEPTDNMTWQDILSVAMRRELAAMNLYDSLATLVEGDTEKQLFQNLAAEESKHKLYFESIWDKEILQEN